MKIALYFGSFNPIHIGHLIIAEFVVSNQDIGQVWLVVSPQNPLKNPGTLLKDYHRLHLANLALEDNAKLKTSNIEFKLPRPSYTIDTLTFLREQYPQHTFSIIIGSDSHQNIHKWKNYNILLDNYEILIYKRPGFPIGNIHEGSSIIMETPLLDISSTLIRNLIKAGKSIKYLVPEIVRIEIENQNFYR